MAADTVQTNGSAIYNDWPGRYFHVDQVLDRPGPRTDPSFLAGDGVSDFLLKMYKILDGLLLG
jgi:NEDD8-activating enzyme E1